MEVLYEAQNITCTFTTSVKFFLAHLNTAKQAIDVWGPTFDIMGQNHLGQT